MKLLVFIPCLCLLGLSTIAQDTLYYNAAWRDTTAAQAMYFRIRTKDGAGWNVTDHYRNGKIQMTGAYLDDSCTIKQGPFAWFDNSGKLEHECSYAANKEEGKETYYYANGKINVTGSYKDGKRDGDWIGYYPNGQKSGEAKYADDKQVSGTFYNDDGSRNKHVKEFIHESEFPGGAAAWLRYLNKNLHYPDNAYAHKIEGTVIVQFIVTPEGDAAEVQVIKHADPQLDAEAKRVIASTSSWQPAVFGGRLVKSYKKQPIVFKLQP